MSADTIGVVVGSQELGESDRILRLLTPHVGRLSVIARRARSAPKQWAGLVDVGTQLRYELRPGRGELRVFARAERLSAPLRARDDLVRIAMLVYGAELCAALAPEGSEAVRLYRLLCTWLDLLEGEGTPNAPSVLALEGKALTFAGLTPSLARCTRCGGALTGEVRFDAEAGGALHMSCGAGQRVPLSLLAELDALRRSPLAETVERDQPALSRHLAGFVEHHTRRELRSRALVEDLLGTG